MIAEKKPQPIKLSHVRTWQISVEALESEAVRREVEKIKNSSRGPQTKQVEGQHTLFSWTW
jgi:hypothetical protein